MTIKYIATVNKDGAVAEVPMIYDPAWPDIEDYVEGVSWDTDELGPIPEPETPTGYTYKRMIQLEGEGAPRIFYTYSPAPEPEETQVQRLQKQVDMLNAQTAALASGQEMQEDVITEIVMHVYE